MFIDKLFRAVVGIAFEFCFCIRAIIRRWSSSKSFFNALFSFVIFFDIVMLFEYALDMDAIRVLYSIGSIGVCIYGLHIVNDNTEE